MRRLVTSDWQLAHNERDRYRTDFVVKTLPALITKHKPDQLLILGDITELKDQHPAPLVNEIVDTLCNLASSFEIEIFMLQGNHDFLHNAHPYFAFLENFKGIHWIAKPEVIDNCLYLPHTRDYKKDWAKPTPIDFGGHDFVFAHNIFEGVKANGQTLSGIPRSIFPDDALVISGDVHEPQRIGSIVYVGSPCLCDYGDEYQPRVLLLDNLKMTSIKVHGQQKRLVEYYYPNKVEHNANPDDIVKIRVHLEMQHVSEWADIRSKVEDWAKQNQFIVNSIIPQVAYVIGERQKVVKSSKRSDNEYLTSFVQRSGIDERTAAIGREIIDLI